MYLVEVLGGHWNNQMEVEVDNYCPDVWEGWAERIIWYLTFLHFYTLEELMSPTEDDLADIALFKSLLIFILWASSGECDPVGYSVSGSDLIKINIVTTRADI